MSKKVKEMIGGCCVCSDERGWSENPLVYCDGAGCNVAVHQACYGIVQVPTGPWFCRKCESQERVARVKCELCPQRAGALKRTDAGGWCHVVCALYIPEACFANVQTMEPIVLNAVPHERFNKICYICEEQKRDTKATAGACMQCNRTTCKQYFHVTCAQAQGLLCEVTGSYENVTYCGYCSHHYKKLKNHSNVKTIPAFRPIPNENGTSDSSPEKSSPPKLEMSSKNTKKTSIMSLTSIHSTKITSKPTPPSSMKAVEAEKSPQVDQSVSSTSDSVPVSCNASGNSNATIKTDPASQISAQVSDVSSAVSPTGGCVGEGDGQKSSCESGGGSSDHSIQEPSSSSVGVVGITSSVSAGQPDKGAASSSTEQLEVDIENESIDEGLPKELPMANAMTKRHHSGSQDSSRKSHSKKQKGDSLDRKEKLKKAIKKRRDLGSGCQASSSKQQLKSPPMAASALPGHHDYCGNTFGGGPYFQSLSTSGRVSMPSLSSNDHFTHFPYPSGMGFGFQDNRFFGEPNQLEMDSSDLIQPPKYFPSLNTGSPSRIKDRSQDMPLSMERLLEQQWEQGAQFLMQQGDHFDISSLLNCLHKLKGENLALEEQVKDLKSRRNHLMMVNARLALPLSLFDNNAACASGPGGSEDITESATQLSKASSSVGSLEDISSPDDVQTAKVPLVHIPSHTNLIVEDIVSPVETPQAPLSLLPHLKPESEEAGTSSDFPYTNQTCPPQPLMYSAVNPPPPSLSAISPGSSKPVSSSLKPPSLTLSSSSFSVTLSSPSSSSLSSLMPPTLDASHIPSLSGLSLTSQTD